MRIGLDFDGVIFNCGKLKSETAKKIYGIEIPPEKFRKEVVVGSNILTEEQYIELLKTIYRTYEIGLLMKPVNGVLRYLPRLIADGHLVVIITSRGEPELKVAKKLAIRHGLQLDFISSSQGQVADEYNPYAYEKSKAEATAGLDVFLDDDLDKLIPLVGIVPWRFLFSWGYNAHESVGNIARRVSSWKEFYGIIRTMKNDR